MARSDVSGTEGHRDAEPAAGAITIDPKTNELTLNPTDILDEAITVTVPGGHRCGNLNLVASPSIAPLVAAIEPPGGYTPAGGEQDQKLAFRVRFHGIPCGPEPQVVTGTIDVVCDQRVVARKDVRISVPACAPTSFVYAATFICGEQAGCGCDCTSVRPGRYATQVNIHNSGTKEVTVRKRFVPVVLASAPIGREPKAVSPRAEDGIVLPPQSATMDDCCRIAELLFGGRAASRAPVTSGILEITADGPVAVTVIFTVTGLDGPGVSIKVKQVAARRA